MKFADLVGRKPTAAVEAIHILGDDVFDDAGGNKLIDEPMANSGHSGNHRDALWCVAALGLASPHAFWTPKIRNIGTRANTGSREENAML